MDQATAPAASVAFAAYVDNNYLPGFETLLKSLLLTNPWIDHDVVVYYDDLTAESLQRISLLYPRLVFERVDTERYAGYAKGDRTNYLVQKAYYILEAFRNRRYDRLVTLDVDMVVLGDVRELVTTTARFAAAPQYFDSRGGWRINSGVMSFDRSVMSDAFVARMDEIGVTGAYDLERHDQGVLSAVLDGDYERLDMKYNFVKRAVKPGGLLPPDVRILHYTGSIKPWSGGEVGYGPLEQHWHDADLSVPAFWRAAARVLPEHSSLHPFYAGLAQRWAHLDDEQLADLRGTAAAARAAGDFAGAADALRLLLTTKSRPTAGEWLDLGQALRAVSEDDAALVALNAATASSLTAPKAFAQTAELHWVNRDYDAAGAALTQSLQHDPTQRKAQLLRDRIDRSRRTDRVVPPGDGPAIGHVAFYVDTEGNFGDVMLPLAVRTSVGAAVPDARWVELHVHQLFDVEQARWANEHLDALVVGGGGLFLPDTSPNGNSGWQWNVTDEALDALTVPLVVYTVGYNLFNGQEVHGDRFAASIRAFVEKAAFVGLRNHGSVEAVRQLVGPGTAAKVEWLPCVTTVYGPRAGRPDGEPAADVPVVHLNIAYDRESLRFGDGYASFVAELADFVRSLRGTATVRCLAHAKTDERIVRDLRVEHDVRLPVDPLYLMEPAAALDVVAGSSLVIGMRGHAGMIPFGVGTPIVSLVSHPKLQYFLDDVRHPEWGIGTSDPELAKKLEDLTRRVLADPVRARDEVRAAREGLMSVVDAADRRVADLVRG